MKEAIELAIKGGYPTGGAGQTMEFSNRLGKYCTRSIFDEPLFWKALGKSLGWGNSCNHFESKTWLPYRHQAKCEVGKYKWEIQWHDFIDHIASGGEVNEFFKKLIK